MTDLSYHTDTKHKLCSEYHGDESEILHTDKRIQYTHIMVCGIRQALSRGINTRWQTDDKQQQLEAECVKTNPELCAMHTQAPQRTHLSDYANTN